VDPFGGESDLKAKIIRAVGEPRERFREDALRLLRAVRFSAQLGFKIEPATLAAVRELSSELEFISKERIRDEFSKLLQTSRAVAGVELLRETGLLRHIFPELLEGVGMSQNKHHIYSVYEHNLYSLGYAVKEGFTLDLRIASLLHDVGKPRTKRGEGPSSTFYGHQVVGEQLALVMLDRLRFPRDLIEKVALLVREHMFVYDPETVTLAGVRRLVARVGRENVDDLMKIREADRIGSGVPKAQPYRLRYLKAMVEKVGTDPVHPKMLALRGDAVVELLKIEPGPRVGKVLAVLLEEVLDDPKLNAQDILTERVLALGKLSDDELDGIAARAKEKAAEAQDRIDDEIKKKYFVK
jgi:poly(A) polymerase/tRNA nucleotidyltransferase (CCA-adding enzyme)